LPFLNGLRGPSGLQPVTALRRRQGKAPALRGQVPCRQRRVPDQRRARRRGPPLTKPAPPPSPGASPPPLSCGPGAGTAPGRRRLIGYAEEPRDVHWDGPVLVRVWPDEEGKVGRWEVDRPRGDDRIAAALEGVIHKWRFAVHPAWSLAGRPPPAVVVRLDPPQSE